MWIKNLFSTPSQPQPDPQKPNPQFQQQTEPSPTSISIDLAPDIRYNQFKPIPYSPGIKFPLSLLHRSQAILMHEVNLFNARLNQGQQWKQVNVLVTDRQVMFTPNVVDVYARRPANFYRVAMGAIERCEMMQMKKKEAQRLKIVLKNNKQLYLKCVIGDLVQKLKQIIVGFSFVQGVNRFYAFRYYELNSSKEQKYRGWRTYNIMSEFLRQGLVTEDQGGLPLKYVHNENFQLSPTYPQLLVVPSRITEAQLKKCANFRTKQRFPAMTYLLEYKPNKYSAIFRCSQNKVGVLSSRSIEDQTMIKYIGDLTGQDKPKNCKIYDARGYYAALGNMIAGKGYQRPEYYSNCDIQWLNIPNIHAVRQSYNAMMNYDRDRSGNFYALCAQTGWYDYLQLIITGAKSIAKDLLSGVNVVVHCSDGWDRTSQLCALSQLIIDPYYRTIEGLAVLVQKDWRHFGHKFRERTGQYNSADYHPYEKSPIFLQFLDCIYQLMQQFPLSFEYNEQLLKFLADNIDSNVYGTFMANNIRQSQQLQLETKTISIWSQVMEDWSQFRNPYYVDNLGEFWLDVGAAGRDMRQWRALFLGEGCANRVEYQVMRHQVEMNKILKGRLASNQEQIEQLTNRLKQLQS